MNYELPIQNSQRVAFFSPLNPVQSGISDYSEELLLTMHGARVNSHPVHIDMFVDKGYRPDNITITSRFRVLPASRFSRVAGRYSSIVYQMGNSPAHAYIYEELLRNPGVVVMHEFVLHHLRQWMALNHGKRKAYLGLMEGKYGDEGREAARRVMLGQFPEALFNYPLSDEAIHAAKGVIVHSRYMAGLVREVRPNVPLLVVPMGVPLQPHIPKDDARAQLGLDPDLFLITSVGHLNPYKRVSATLRAFKSLLMEVPRSLYLLVGSRSPNYDPSRQIDMLGLSDRVRFTGYASPRHFALYLAASDVCLNLRYPTAGETSASLLRIMGAGVPVLVSRTGSFEELPDSAVGKIDVSDIEEDLLLEYLLLLARRPDLREAMSAAARRYVAEHHTLEQAAEGYLRFLTSLEAGKSTGTPRIELHPVPVVETFERSNVSTLESASPAIQQPANSDTPERSNVQTFQPSNVGEADPLAMIADAAADLGIEESDEAVLSSLADAVKDLL